jgi:3-oxoacyl-[acyl-carrier protein] reductase
MSKLQGKVAVVTGASKGIGAGIVEALGKEGASVVVNYSSDHDGATRVVAAIKDHGGKAIAVQADVSKAADVTRLFAEADKAFGRLDVLVNNAGVFKFASIEEFEEQEFHRQFNTNVLGLLLATKEAAARFGKEGGSIINISSTITTAQFPNTAIYTATKGAVDAITGVLSKELGPRNIRVNAINPGGTLTEGLISMGVPGSDFEKQMIASTPLGRLGTPADIGAIAVFLASQDSGWISGETIRAAGGSR